jgi:predicted dehydrogenase
MINRRTALALTALSSSKILGANERLKIGVIGCGGMANGHMRTLLKMKESDNCEIVAVCDVYDKRREAAAALTSGEQEKDYRRLLDRKDIDYVLIATPEHWHFQMAMDAVSAGKHVYCEKPMTRHSEQAKRLVAKVKASKLKFQVGVQGMSDDSYETARKYVEQGALGKVVLAQIDYSRNHRNDFWTGTLDNDVKPGVNLDWNAFLGPARKRPFEIDRFLHWRRYWDYSGGIASDLFVHRVTRIIKALNLDFPEKGVGAGGKFLFTDSKAEIPDTINILLDYPGGPTVQLISSMANDTRVDHLLRGHKATLEFTSTGFTITPQGLYREGAQTVEHKKTGAEALDLHHRNLHAAIRENAALKCDVDLGYRGVVAVEMGNMSYLQRKYMAWDRTRERIVST